MNTIYSVGSSFDNMYFFVNKRDLEKATNWLFENTVETHLVYYDILNFYKDRLEELIREINYQKQVLNKQDEQISDLLNDKLELEGLIKNES